MRLRRRRFFTEEPSSTECARRNILAKCVEIFISPYTPILESLPKSSQKERTNAPSFCP